MIVRSQVITIRVMYDGDSEEQVKDPPAQWDWDALIDEPITGAVEVLAAGPIVDYPRPGEEE